MLKTRSLPQKFPSQILAQKKQKSELFKNFLFMRGKEWFLGRRCLSWFEDFYEKEVKGWLKCPTLSYAAWRVNLAVGEVWGGGEADRQVEAVKLDSFPPPLRS